MINPRFRLDTDLENPLQQNYWSTLDAMHLYGMDRWGRGFFSVDSLGDVIINSETKQGKRIRYNLAEIIRDTNSDGLEPPLIVRFPGIIRQRIKQLHNAFDKAISEFDYKGNYRFIYPIKVNQHAEVIDATLDVADQVAIGLESGSKAELLTVVAKATNDTKILCNGFKDRSMIELAFRASQIGRDVTIVIEKLSDIDLIATVAQDFNQVPKLGIRTKLSWQGAGHWRSSNGPRSKFGLTATELLNALISLRDAKLLEHVHLLHFHPGSQINDVREIKSALNEITRVYVDLVKQGVPLDTIDVGGGLAVDYTGNQNREASSMNYTVQEYANDVVYYIQMVCNQARVPHPNLYSESGRAVTAHHSVLIIPIFASSDKVTEDISARSELDSVDETNPNLQSVRELAMIYAEVDKQLSSMPKPNHRFLTEAYHDAQQALETSLQLFINGYLTLEQRSQAELRFWNICARIREVLYTLDFVPDELLQMRDMLCDTYFANFSVFQSLPDFWAIDQLFPVVPIHRLNERPTKRGVIGDITCDSDGQINCFLSDSSDDYNSLPLHELRSGQPYWLGVFLVGAYQEALSDDHNLMGKFHMICVDESADSGETKESPKTTTLLGSTLREVIEHVDHDWNLLVTRFEQACDEALENEWIDAQMHVANKQFFNELSEHYTYLKSFPGEVGMAPQHVEVIRDAEPFKV